MDEFVDVRNRVMILEKQCSMDQNRLTAFMRQGEAFGQTSTQSLMSIKREIQKLKLDIGGIKLKMLLLIKSLRHTSSNSDLDRVKMKAEHWDPQSCITVSSFEKMLKELIQK